MFEVLPNANVWSNFSLTLSTKQYRWQKCIWLHAVSQPPSLQEFLCFHARLCSNGEAALWTNSCSALTAATPGVILLSSWDALRKCSVDFCLAPTGLCEFLRILDMEGQSDLACDRLTCNQLAHLTQLCIQSKVECVTQWRAYGALILACNGKSR